MLSKAIRKRYKVIKALDSSFGEQTYLARNLDALGTPICIIKTIQLQDYNPESLKAAKHVFKNEVEALRRIEQYNRTPQILDYFEDTQAFYLVQEYIEGKTLREQFKHQQLWNEHQAVLFLKDMLQILELIHHQHITHRDIRPENVIYRVPDQRLLLINFGIIQHLSRSNREQIVSKNLCSRGYNSQAQLRMATELNRDICALGMICLEALTGVSPESFLQFKSAKPKDSNWSKSIEASSEFKAILSRMVSANSQSFYPNASCILLDLSCMGQSLNNPKLKGNYTPTEIFSSGKHLLKNSTVYTNNPVQNTYIPTELGLECIEDHSDISSEEGEEELATNFSFETSRFQPNRRRDSVKQLSLELAEYLADQQKIQGFNKIIKKKTTLLCFSLVLMTIGITLLFVLMRNDPGIEKRFPQPLQSEIRNLMKSYS